MLPAQLGERFSPFTKWRTVRHDVVTGPGSGSDIVHVFRLGCCWQVVLRQHGRHRQRKFGGVFFAVEPRHTTVK